MSMFKSRGFWLSAVGFLCAAFFAQDLFINDYLGVMLGCFIASIADNLGKYWGDK